MDDGNIPASEVPDRPDALEQLALAGDRDSRRTMPDQVGPTVTIQVKRLHQPNLIRLAAASSGQVCHRCPATPTARLALGFSRERT